MSKGLLQERTAIVTGAGRGIGKAVALALAREGATVVLAARTEEELCRTGREIESEGGKALACPTDLTVEDDISRLIKMTGAVCGGLDILVNNAGIGVYGPLDEASAEDWDRLMAVNARAPFLLCRDSLPLLRRRKPSYIINITSVVGIKGYAGQVIYSASKHAVMGLTKALAREVQDDGIRVHAICPGGVDTAMAGQARPDLDRTLLMQPEEIADAVLFLVTRRGRAVIDELHLRRETAQPWA